MLNNPEHRLLKRQLKKSNLEHLSSDPNFAKFLEFINSAYFSFDRDLNRIENILEQSSKELVIANKQLIIERDKTKNKLANLVDNIGGVIFETDPIGNFTFVNHAWETYSGYSINETIGKNFLDFLKEEDIDGDKSIRQIFGKKRNKIKFIFKHKNKDKLMWFELKAKSIENEVGRFTGYIGTISEVTNLKETEIELHKASKAKDAFLSTMSHEIRTPLNAVTGLTNILLMEEHLPDQLENLKALKYSGEHLLGLINDLLDFDKIKSGKIKLNEKDFNLTALLENIKSHFIIRAEKNGIIFNVIKENDLPEYIIGDQLKLTQVIKNLLSNSLKFTEKGSIILKIKKLQTENNKVTLRFKVIDTGIGISKAKQKSIFESFVQANSDISVKYGGTGLGLSICKQLLGIQNSDLKVKSTLGQGATFSFKLQFKLSNRLCQYEPEMVQMQTKFEPLNLKVLVAEDNKMNVLIVKKIFAKWNIDLTIANNGQEVLDIIEEKDFDLILMDLQMPVLNGYETTKKIRNLKDQFKSTVPIIALTAFAQTDVKEKTQLYKMNGFMSKPFDPAKLYNLLRFYKDQSINKCV
ncbi:PAS domain-containing hybrid sensor histidine kinase/response regulator [Seonamhaeicola marinus]|uniref:histidine kinase n=1 Tax=Seonamhaeicola marinus TaxID=1912246 RepID=A0A5D0HEL3_9FLAO|nr:ATP-binding protein [Seonamhaeicola marinus]TYA69798.1 response regulator [Seonamhaeicola marinus]